jgi:putative transposase
MYEYRKLTPEQRAELVRKRLAQGCPPHSPPHPIRDQPFYLLTATCYDHVCHIAPQRRRQEVLDALFEQFISTGMEIRAWVVLPNHYHLLAHVTDFDALGGMFRLVHGPARYVSPGARTSGSPLES